MFVCLAPCFLDHGIFLLHLHQGHLLGGEVGGLTAALDPSRCSIPRSTAVLRLLSSARSRKMMSLRRSCGRSKEERSSCRDSTRPCQHAHRWLTVRNLGTVSGLKRMSGCWSVMSYNTGKARKFGPWSVGILESGEMQTRTGTIDNYY